MLTPQWIPHWRIREALKATLPDNSAGKRGFASGVKSLLSALVGPTQAKMLIEEIKGAAKR